MFDPIFFFVKRGTRHSKREGLEKHDLLLKSFFNDDFTYYPHQFPV